MSCIGNLGVHLEFLEQSTLVVVGGLYTGFSYFGSENFADDWPTAYDMIVGQL